MPKALFSPAEHYVQVVFLQDNSPAFYCPCCLGDTKSEYLELRASESFQDGITTDMFLQQIGRALYGTDGDPTWHVGTEDERPVLKLFSCMITDSSMVGNIYAYLKGIRREDINEDSDQNHKAINLS